MNFSIIAAVALLAASQVAANCTPGQLVCYDRLVKSEINEAHTIIYQAEEDASERGEWFDQMHANQVLFKCIDRLTTGHTLEFAKYCGSGCRHLKHNLEGDTCKGSSRDTPTLWDWAVEKLNLRLRPFTK